MSKALTTRILSDSSEGEVQEESVETVVQKSKGAMWFHGATDMGQVRANNEDQFLCDAERGLFVVADGMGGHAAGEEASRIAIEILSAALSLDAVNGADLHERMVEALRCANAEIIRQSRNNYEWRGMGSTAVVAVLKGGLLHMVNVGDSRAYVVRNGKMYQVSRDHSVAAVLAEQKQIERKDVRTHALRNRLTMCLGIAEEIHPDGKSVRLKADDFVLLCSDGLWDMLPDEEIARLLQLYPSPPNAVSALIQAANEAGGKDNITAIVLQPRQMDSGDVSPLQSTTVNAVDDASEDTVVVRH